MEKLQIIFYSIFSLIALALGGGFFVRKLWRKKQAVLDAQEAENEDALSWQRLKAILNACLFGLVTDAQREYGGDNGTGKAKLSSVLYEVMEIIPDNLKGLIKLDVLVNYIEKALSAARPAWEAAPALLVPDGLDVTVEEIAPLRVVPPQDLKAGEVALLYPSVAISIEGDGEAPAEKSAPRKKRLKATIEPLPAAPTDVE